MSDATPLVSACAFRLTLTPDDTSAPTKPLHLMSVGLSRDQTHALLTFPGHATLRERAAQALLTCDHATALLLELDPAERQPYYDRADAVLKALA